MFSREVERQAAEFIACEQQFHLGFLPTEQSNPLSRTLEADFRHASADGVRTLQRVDAEVAPMARRVFAGPEFAQLVERGVAVLRQGGRIVFSGCGATGRLSILLEAMWRNFFRRLREQGDPRGAAYENSVLSIMTGGDFALIKSVESFEDYAVFGRRQVAELGMTAADMLVAITEGGETSSVLGTLTEATERGAHAFLLFNNPAELLAERLERSREAIRNPNVTVIDLFCGPMGLAGSTRMQATTSEQLVAGAALERMAGELLPDHAPRIDDFAAAYETMLAQLATPEAVRALAAAIEFECDTYRRSGKITYWAGDCLLDLFTDTTERSPTFMLPPFRMSDDTVSPQSWAFVKNPLLDTAAAWARVLERPMRCLNWSVDDYRAMNAPEKLIRNPPQLNAAALLRFAIGNETPTLRTGGPADAGVLFTVSDGEERYSSLSAAFDRLAATAAARRRLHVGDDNPGADFFIRFALPETPLKLMTHLAVKLVWNNISTGTMVRFGRVSGNWMSWVSVSNKKLLDRGIRLLAELGGIDYREACCRIFAAIEELDAMDWAGKERPSPVQHALGRLLRQD